MFKGVLLFLAFCSGYCYGQVVRPQPRINEPLLRSVANKKISIFQTKYHGWSESWIINNGKAEIVVVPSIGRVMQFRLVDQEGVFWENRNLDGQKTAPLSSEWSNFGGDKAWPAPQSDWLAITSRAWPPPQGFDAVPCSAVAGERSLTLTSPIDTHYGIRTIRRIQLDPIEPVMMISTTFEKVSGKPIKTSIWVVTQLKDPVLAAMAIPPNSRFNGGYSIQSKDVSPRLKVDKDVLFLKRDTKNPYKIGGDGSSLLWIGKECGLLIESSRVANLPYPDNECSIEIYTNPDPSPYIELETLGPIQELKPGEKITRNNKYTLFRRTSEDPITESRNILTK